MHVYRFKITTELDEDFEMVIEMLANQTFLDFHNAIKDFIGIKSNELASFYTCNDNNRKLNEITLIDMSVDSETKKKIPIYTMSNVKLNEVITNPHQKFIYVYDFINYFSFDIQLCKIKEKNGKISYPHLVQKTGNLVNNEGQLKFEHLKIVDPSDNDFISLLDKEDADILNLDDEKEIIGNEYYYESEDFE